MRMLLLGIALGVAAGEAHSRFLLVRDERGRDVAVIDSADAGPTYPAGKDAALFACMEHLRKEALEAYEPLVAVPWLTPGKCLFMQRQHQCFLDDCGGPLSKARRIP